MAKTRFANADLNQSFGSTTVPAVTFNLRYPGQYFDQESGLHYNYHRSYSATTGRYTQSDPIGLDGGWNRFNYAELNPISIVDPLGLSTKDGAPLCAHLEKGQKKCECEFNARRLVCGVNASCVLKAKTALEQCLSDCL